MPARPTMAITRCDFAAGSRWSKSMANGENLRPQSMHGTFRSSRSTRACSRQRLRRPFERLREVHPEIPIVLTAPGMEFDWVETSGLHSVVPLVDAPTAATLQEAVGKALASVGKDPVGRGTLAG